MDGCTAETLGSPNVWDDLPTGSAVALMRDGYDGRFPVMMDVPALSRMNGNAYRLQ